MVQTRAPKSGSCAYSAILAYGSSEELVCKVKLDITAYYMPHRE
jgi:hypothetical protein